MGEVKEKVVKTLFKSDFRRQTVLVTLPSLLLDLIFISFNFLMGLYMRSLWYFMMCIYYIVITLLRMNVLARSTKALFSKDKTRAFIKIYKSTHRLLLLLTVMLVGAVYMLVDNYIWKSYPGIILYFVALYTVYKVSASIINLFKAGKTGSIVTILLRKIGQADALVSLLILESALIGRSGISRSYKMLGVAAVSGAIVCLIMLVISLDGLFKSRKKLESMIGE